MKFILFSFCLSETHTVSPQATPAAPGHVTYDTKSWLSLPTWLSYFAKYSRLLGKESSLKYLLYKVFLVLLRFMYVPISCRRVLSLKAFLTNAMNVSMYSLADF